MRPEIEERGSGIESTVTVTLCCSAEDCDWSVPIVDEESIKIARAHLKTAHGI